VSSPDVAVIGGGIAGCSVAAVLAEDGARVRLYEREAIAAGASGRNSGILQHPMDPALASLYEASLELYATLGHGFELPREASGVLVIAADAAVLEGEAADFADLDPEWLEGAELAAVEPALAGDLFALRLETGRPVPPAAATRAWAERARAAGAHIEVGKAATVAVAGGRVEGVRVGERLEPAEVVVLAAGPWSREALGSDSWRPVRAAGPSSREALGDDSWPPVRPLWGVVAQVRLRTPPRHSVEQAGVKDLTKGRATTAALFTAVPYQGVVAVGSTFAPEQPDPAAVAPGMLEHGARFMPELRSAGIESVRACARPQSADGRPLLGPVPDIAGLHLLTGHGPWGVTLGPASARLVADGVLGRPVAIPPELEASRACPRR
jgi:D-hydroxyproline dehydrogenase subunit beta